MFMTLAMAKMGVWLLDHVNGVSSSISPTMPSIALVKLCFSIFVCMN